MIVEANEGDRNPTKNENAESPINILTSAGFLSVLAKHDVQAAGVFAGEVVKAKLDAAIGSQKKEGFFQRAATLFQRISGRG